jgi:hypothetical protein
LAKKKTPSSAEEADRVLTKLENHPRLKPDAYIYTAAMHCIALSNHKDALARNLELLNKMEDLAANGDLGLRPFVWTYTWVIYAASNSMRPQKAQLALQLLRQMQSVTVADTHCLTNVINACMYSGRDGEDAKECLRIAEGILCEARQGPGANWLTYKAILRVVYSVEDNSRSRFWKTRDILMQCAEDGVLGEHILKVVKSEIPRSDYAALREEVCDHKSGSLRKEFTVMDRHTRSAPTLPKPSSW